VTWRFFKIIVYKHHRDASLELQQNAQMCISIVTEETVHQVALSRVDGIEWHALLSVMDIPNTCTVAARLFSYINVLMLLTNGACFKKWVV
jgi:hypothetical protein